MWRSLTIAGIIILLTGLILGIIGEVDRIRRIIWGVEAEVKFYNYNLEGYLADEVTDVIITYANHNIQYPLRARINEKTGAIIPETKGKIIDITATVDKILNAREAEKIRAVNYQIIPDLKKSDLISSQDELVKYKTRILGSKNRKDNIRLAAELINNTLLASGEIFSFNREVGPRKAERGFKESPQIVEGRLTLGVGGGICQVSSTLYNAVLKQNLTIIEHHHHSQEVGYVPEGQDAAVAWRYLDFKFKNSLTKPLIIKAKVNEEQLEVRLLGNKNYTNKISQ